MIGEWGSVRHEAKDMMESTCVWAGRSLVHVRFANHTDMTEVVRAW